MLEYKEIKLENLSEITEIYMETFNAEPWNDNWTIETASKRLHQIITTEDFYGICAYNNGEICGLILGNMEQFYDGIMFNIKEFVVRNNMRGHGLGSKIFKEFETRLKNLGISEIILLTIRGKYTEHFYHNQGVKTCNDLIFMKKQL